MPRFTLNRMKGTQVWLDLICYEGFECVPIERILCHFVIKILYRLLRRTLTFLPFARFSAISRGLTY